MGSSKQTQPPMESLQDAQGWYEPPHSSKLPQMLPPELFMPSRK